MAMVAAGTDRREPAHFHHPHIFTAAADNRRQPQYKAVYADTRAKYCAQSRITLRERKASP